VKTSENMEALLSRAVQHHMPGASGISELRRLTGGASKETWSFHAIVNGKDEKLILRRGRGGDPDPVFTIDVSLATEALLMERASQAGVPVPEVKFVLKEIDRLGEGFVMSFVEGETIARKVLRDDKYAAARDMMAFQLGEILAKVATMDTSGIDELARVTPAEQVDRVRNIYQSFDEPFPVIELAFKWLDAHLLTGGKMAMAHGDFRHGNMIIGPDGVRAIIDWEIPHVGDPIEDLGWVCTNVWRFGVSDKPVGGFGTREDLFAGYEAGGGGTVDPDRVHFWEVFGCLNWGIICMMMTRRHLLGHTQSVELVTIGRRAMEGEIDLLNLIGA
jgi:aminoglycoside phosphotransferase (APT) family kinase protein